MIGADPKTDLALLKVKGDGTFPFVGFAAQAPRVGDWVIAVGNPFGLGGTVTAGIVSARGRDIGSGPYDDFLQIDAPVNHGNSGGPTFNTDGEVVGVNTAIFSPSGGSVGIGFAIASDVVKNVVAQLKENGAVARGWLGVEIQPVTPDLADSLGVKDRLGRAGRQGDPEFPGRDGRRQGRRRDHRGQRRQGRRSHANSRAASPRSARRRSPNSRSCATARRRPSTSRSARCRPRSSRRASRRRPSPTTTSSSPSSA